jgi:hypothetical protein
VDGEWFGWGMKFIRNILLTGLLLTIPFMIGCGISKVHNKMQSNNALIIDLSYKYLREEITLEDFWEQRWQLLNRNHAALNELKFFKFEDIKILSKTLSSNRQLFYEGKISIKERVKRDFITERDFAVAMYNEWETKEWAALAKKREKK